MTPSVHAETSAPVIPPNLLRHFDEALAPLLPHAAKSADAKRASAKDPDAKATAPAAPRVGLALDFDGTLSEFALSPSDAVIAPDALPPLARLAASLPLTAVVSGRAAQDVAARVGVPAIVYVGNHGAERIIDGELAAAPNAQPAPDDMQRLLDRVRQALENDDSDDAAAAGFVWENKGFSATIHYRAVADESQAAQRLSAAMRSIPEIAALDAFWGNKIVEMRQRNGPNKGAALNALIAERQLNAVIFVGDDATDADALRALRRRRNADGIATLGVAVIQPGAPPSVLEAADYTLNGVPEVAQFLRRLADRAAPTP